MIEKTISLPQVHYRGIPSPKNEPNYPSSIIELLSTSLKVTLLRCWLEQGKIPINEHELFDVSDSVVDKTKKIFYYIGGRDLVDHFKINNWSRVKLLVPKSPNELRRERNMQLSVWPAVFLCNECGRIFKPTPQDIRSIIESGSFPECRKKGCGGELRQTPHILQCKICGSIRQFPTKCIDCKSPLHLRKGTETDIETWRLECDGKPSHTHDFRDYKEYWCDNEEGLIPNDMHRQYANGKKAPRTPMTTVGKGIATPLTYRFPTGNEDQRLSDEEWMMIGINSHILTIEKFHSIDHAKKRFREGGDLWNREKSRLLHEGLPHSPNDVNSAVKKLPADGIEESPTLGKFEKMKELGTYKVKNYNFTVTDPEALLRRAQDWVTLVSGQLYQHTQERNTNLDLLIKEKPELRESIQNIRNRLRIIQVRYIDNIALVTGTYGILRGSIRPIFRGQELPLVKVPLSRVPYEIDYATYRPKYVENDRLGFPVIVTKKNTEGIVFTLQAKKILQIISKKESDAWNALTNEATKNPLEFSEEEARAWLLYASFDETYGEKIKDIATKIVHTVSHAIIHRFSRVSGLREEDLSEMLFPEFAGFVLYNGLMNSLGMLKRVYEDSLIELLDLNIIDEMEDCDMDPTCYNQMEGAACHACLHTAEHVCENFNSALDRKILIATEGYWK